MDFFFALIYMKEKDEVHFEIKKKKEKKYMELKTKGHICLLT